MALGAFLTGPIGAVALGTFIAVISGINSDDWYSTAKAIVVDKYGRTLEYIKDYMGIKAHVTITKHEYTIRQLKKRLGYEKDFFKSVFDDKVAKQSSKINIEIGVNNSFLREIIFEQNKNALAIKTAS